MTQPIKPKSLPSTGGRWSRTFWWRSSSRAAGMSMRTGHTSKHAPHSDDA